MQYTPDKLSSILSEHRKWILSNDREGCRANFSNADLSDADLRDAELSGADLHDANLSRANLSRANLSRANLNDADLSDANLSRAYLIGAILNDTSLSRADLSGAYLSRAKFRGADLSRADLSRAFLRDVNFSGADLSRANLSGADLRDANLNEVREEFFAKNSQQPEEVPGLRGLLMEGRIEGTSYDGDCSCYVGSLERLANQHGKECRIQRDPRSLIERWFLGIKRGDTPETNPISAIVVEWIDEWTEAFYKTKV